MAVLPHEGTYAVMYGGLAVSIGSSYRRGYLARPDKAGRFPTVLLVPSIDGIGAHEKNVARALARSGLAVLAVDLHLTATSDHDEALAAYNDLSDGEAIRILDEAYEYLCSDDLDWPHTSGVGVLGLDVGGRFALIQTAHRQWATACAVVGTPLTGDEERRYPVADMLEHLPSPVLGLYGADDQLVAAESVDEAQRRNVTGTWLLYESAQHGFLDEAGPEYHEASAGDALARISSFFLSHLQQPEEVELG